MARLQRVTSKVFAENATEVGQFGSLNAGTKVTTTDITEIQSLPAWQNGWQAAIVGENCYPTLQERNGLDKVQSYFLNYLLQEGIPEWDSGTTYYQGSIVKLINGTNVQLYQSLINNNTSALSDTTAWVAYDYADRTLSNVTSLSSNIQTLLNAIYQAKITGSAGDSSTPCYMSNGAWYSCSGLSSSLRCSSRTTISSTKPDMVIAQGGSGTSGYRVWSSGFKECWGLFDTDSTFTTVNNYQVTISMGSYSFTQLPIISTTNSFDAAFSADGTTFLNSNGADFSGVLNRITNTSFYISRLSRSRQFGWYARGY